MRETFPRVPAGHDGGCREGSDADGRDGSAVQHIRAHVARLHTLIAQLNGTQQEREHAMEQLAHIDDRLLASAADEQSHTTQGGYGAFERGRLEYISRFEAHKPIAPGPTAGGEMRAPAAIMMMTQPPSQLRLTDTSLGASTAPAVPWHFVPARDEPRRSSSVHASSAAVHTLSSDARRLRLATGEPESGACSIAVSKAGLEAYHRGRNEFNLWVERQRLGLAHAHSHAYFGSALLATQGEMRPLAGYFDPRCTPSVDAYAQMHPAALCAQPQQLAARCQPVAMLAQRPIGKGKRKSPDMTLGSRTQSRSSK